MFDLMFNIQLNLEEKKKDNLKSMLQIQIILN